MDSDILGRLKEIEKQQDIEPGDAYYEFERLVDELFDKKDYQAICEIYHTKFGNSMGSYSFEVAYSLNEKRYKNEAEQVYENILETDDENSAVLNNLSNIKEEKGEYAKAYDFISRAKKVNPDDSVVLGNYERLKRRIDEIESKKKLFEHALERLPAENQFVRNKLETFLANIKKEADFKQGLVPIPNWKFKVLMQTDEQKAESLKRQWIDKGYIRKSDQRTERYVIVYEINPFLEEKLVRIQTHKINEQWIKGFENLNIERLEECGYFDAKSKISRIKKTYREIIDRDYSELILNYIFCNYKSVVVLSGSLVETLLIYYCEKKKIKKISCTIGKSVRTKDIYECDLNDLLCYFQENRIFATQLVHLGNVSRLYRNYIHPGKEVRDTENLDSAKAQICFLCVSEIMKAII